MVDELAAEYADRPVVFLEQDVDLALGDREERWWAGYGGTASVFLPVVMVDSGNQVSNGDEDFRAVYSAMVDAALLRPPIARLEVDRQLVGNAFSFTVELTNMSGLTLGSSTGARLYAMVYEDLSKGTSSRVVRAVASMPITGLEDGETGTFTLPVPLTNAGWGSLPSVVFAEYQPTGISGPWDMLQAAAQE